ncbi:MAG: MBL fold metallo-hydrolase, partial [Clostridiales Family XIII bacterium]|nr:MBL fold metallo-hydrolase [Clostridiales Family XIII bacterium]
DGDVIDLGGRCFEVVLIPGHTPGSIALLDREARILVAGDSVTETPVFIFSEFRSLRAFVESMGRLQALKGAFDSVYGAHGPVPVSPDQIDRLKVAGEKLLAGELEGMAPPFELPARMYEHEGAAFFY